MTHASWQQEEFSLACVRAVAAVAGYATDRHDVDMDGIDLSVHAFGPFGSVRSPRLDLQVKSETSGQPAKFPWSYALKVDNYHKLTPVEFLVPRILVVIAMPADVTAWLKQTPAKLALKHCGYWMSLRGNPPTQNAKTVTIKLPKRHRFSPTELDRLMKMVGQGIAP